MPIQSIILYVIIVALTVLVKHIVYGKEDGIGIDDASDAEIDASHVLEDEHGTGAIELPTVAIPPLGNGVLSPPAYKPGSLHCTGYKNGSAEAFVTAVLTTPGAPTALRVTTEMNQTEDGGRN